MIGLSAYIEENSSLGSVAPITLQPKWISGNRVGGKERSEVVATGDPTALWLSAEMLGRDIKILGRRGNLCWWGMIQESRISIDGLTFGFSLEPMFNRIAVAYNELGADGSSVRYTTAWAVNQDSINRFGTKELLYSLGDGNSAQALAMRDRLLNALAWPRGVPDFGAGDAQQRSALLISIGWWQTLAWKYFQRLEGRIEYAGSTETTGIQQAIGWGLTASNISFSGATLTCGTTDVFTSLAAAGQIVITGSASNNGTFTLARDGYDNGTKLEISGSFTTESAGASVTIKLVGYYTAQQYSQAHAFELWRVGLKLDKVGSPVDSLNVEVQSDSAGSPSGTVLASCTIAAGSISSTAGEYWIDALSNPTLSAGSNYWLVVKRTGALDALNYYLISMDTPVYASCKAWNGATWVSQPQGQYLPFRVWGWEDTLAQLSRILTDCGQFFTGVDIQLTSGIKTNQYRDGDSTALDEALALIETGSSSGGRYTVTVDRDRVVHVVAEAAASESVDILVTRSLMRYAAGGVRVNEEMPVAEWMLIDKAPMHLNNVYGLSPQFFDAVEYDVESDALSLTPKQSQVS